MHAQSRPQPTHPKEPTDLAGATVADASVVQAWVSGWCLSRGMPGPTALPFGWFVPVGQPQQIARYVLPRFDGFTVARLASRIESPWIFMKICADPTVVAPCLPSDWTVQAPIYMMTKRLSQEAEQASQDPRQQGYTARLVQEGSVLRAEVCDGAGNLAANGRGALVGPTCIFDQIVTQQAHRRRGLGTLIMGMLGRRAAQLDKTHGVLVATAEGRKLYLTLDWQLHTVVTSAVITAE